jgi:hypothetical protein
MINPAKVPQSLRTASIGLAASLALVLSAVAYAQDPYSPVGWVLMVKLRQPFTVAAGTSMPRLLESSGQIPANAYPTLSVTERGVIYATAGPSATTCQVGVVGGAVTSPRITVPANSTVALFLEDTGPQKPGTVTLLHGIVVTAGSGGPVTIQPGSTFVETVIPTEAAVY